MSEYNDKAVEQEKYCMPSWQKENVDSMNKMSGYDSTSDLANCKQRPVGMVGEKVNKQLGPKAADNRYDY